MDEGWTDVQKAASVLGKKGGRVKSEKKRISSKNNGFKAGNKYAPKWMEWCFVPRTMELTTDIRVDALEEGAIVVKARTMKEAKIKVWKILLDLSK